MKRDDHEPADERGWTSCVDPRKARKHPANCMHSTHDAFDAYLEMTFAEYAASLEARFNASLEPLIEVLRNKRVGEYVPDKDGLESYLRSVAIAILRRGR